MSKNRRCFLRKLFFVLCILIFTINISAAQKNRNIIHRIKPLPVKLADEPAILIKGKMIKIGEIVRWAVENNHDVIAGSYDAAMTYSLYEKFQKKYSTFLSTGLGSKYEKFPGDLHPSAGENKKSWDASIGIMKNFSTGTTVSGGWQHGYADSKSLVFGDAKYHRSALFVTIQQELLKNAFGINDRKQEKILKNTGKMQKDLIIFQLSNVVMGVISDFWNVAIQKASLANAEVQLIETKRLRNTMKNNVKLGLYDNFNVNYYNALVSVAEAKRAAIKFQFHNAIRDFHRSLNINGDKIENNIMGDEAIILSNKLPVINYEESLKTAYEKRADYKSAQMNIKNAKMQIAIYSNESLPSLTAEITASTMGQRDEFGSSYADSAKFDAPSIQAKISLTYPLDDAEQKINERNARYQLKQADTELKKYKLIVRDDIKSGIEGINTSYSLYEKAKEARIESETFYRKMLKSMRRGRLSAADVKNGLDAFVESRQGELEALVNFNISKLRFDVLKNELWERFDINVNKYIPEK